MKDDFEKRNLPLMGWSSWNCFTTQISEEILLPQVDALVSTGLADAGYTYFNIDDCFQNGRGENDLVISKPHTFPHGMKYMSEYIHSKGLKAGIYTDGGEDTCASNYSKENFVGKGTGLFGHEEEDLRQLLIDWDYDYVKVDWCGGKKLGLDRRTQYTKIGNIIQKLRKEKGKDIIFNVCCWEFPGDWVIKIADSWRIETDITCCFSSVLLEFDRALSLAEYQSPGHVNDPDMLMVGNGMTYEEDKSHFALWCMLSAPLVLGNDLTRMDEATLEIVKNPELIAIDQDALVKPASLVLNKDKVQTYIKPLSNGDKAVLILNRNNCEGTVEISFKDLGFADKIKVRDVFGKKELTNTEHLTLSLAPHGCAVYRITGGPCEITTLKSPEELPAVYDVKLVGKTKAQLIVENGGKLVDVRSDESFDKNRIEGAVHIPFAELLEKAETVIPDKNTKLVVCGSCHKRSSQATKLLLTLGYTDVLDMGPMENWYV